MPKDLDRLHNLSCLFTVQCLIYYPFCFYPILLFFRYRVLSEFSHALQTVAEDQLQHFISVLLVSLSLLELNDSEGA